jgi:hypothetical protein
MKLVDQKPQWLTYEGRRVGFLFVSPVDPTYYQTVTFVPIERRLQIILCEVLLRVPYRVQHARPDFAWTHPSHADLEQADFDTLTVHPSVDGSAGGLWHGWIKDGQIVFL